MHGPVLHRTGRVACHPVRGGLPALEPARIQPIRPFERTSAPGSTNFNRISGTA
jgi:hypothetical protein